MNNTRQTLALARAFARGVSTTTPRNNQVPERILKLRENQKKFGVDDGTPVYIKGGAGDKVLYGATVALIFAGLGLSLDVFWKLTFKD